MVALADDISPGSNLRVVSDDVDLKAKEDGQEGQD